MEKLNLSLLVVSVLAVYVVVECVGDCLDDDINCPYWANSGFCRNDSHMKSHCRKSCDLCYPAPGYYGSGGLRPGNATETNTCQHVRQVPSILRNGTAMKLNSFYQKYTEAYGIPVVASNHVSDRALKRACYVLRFLLAENSAIRQSFYKHSGRVAVIGPRDFTTSIPEYWDLDSWADGMTRGLGATEEIPVASSGEENILCNTTEQYHNEDMLLHETSHGVHVLGAAFSIDGWADRLKICFENARNKSLMISTKRLYSKQEYFAEGVQSYFNVNDDTKNATGVQGPISTRVELKTYDPCLLGVIQEVFPCGNVYLNRCNSSRVEEDTQNLTMNCDLLNNGNFSTTQDLTTHATTKMFPTTRLRTKQAPTTRLTTKQAPTTHITSSQTPTTKDCIDDDERCSEWVYYYPKVCGTSHYMKLHCRKSCNLCHTVTTTTQTTNPAMTVGDDCKDKITDKCQYWANQGYCRYDPVIMRSNCMKTCGMCSTETTSATIHRTSPATTTNDCTDTDSNCEYWANEGHCITNTYMKSHCKKSCKTCHTTIPTIRPKNDCTDADSNCEYWANEGDCNTNTYMKSHCKKSCKTCHTTITTTRPKNGCQDISYICPKWAKDGECYHIPGYMRRYCSKSCNWC